MGTDQDDHAADARWRLLEAASDIFIEQGFKAAKTRDIVKRAHVNLAAINYYFGGKEGLYTAVIQHTASRVFEEQSQRLEAHAASKPEDRLMEYIRIFLKRLLDDTLQARWGKLIARETVEPTAAFDMVVEKYILPAHAELKKIIRAILGRGASEESVRRSAMSVVGLCLYYQTARRAVGRLDPDFHFAPADVSRLAEHITAFSLAGLRDQAQKPSRPAATE